VHNIIKKEKDIREIQDASHTVNIGQLDTMYTVHSRCLSSGGRTAGHVCQGKETDENCTNNLQIEPKVKELTLSLSKNNLKILDLF
jgi:hypothetical protein